MMQRCFRTVLCLLRLDSYAQGAAPGQVIVGKEEVIVGFPDRSAAAIL